MNTRFGVAAAALTLVAPTPTVHAQTVLAIENFPAVSRTPQVLQGSLCQPPNVCVQVDRPYGVDPTQGVSWGYQAGVIHRGAVALEDALETVEDDPLVVSFSQGGQVQTHWLNTFAAGSDSDAEFLMLSSPTNAYGVPWAPKIKDTHGYPVTQMWRQYDGWADFPNRFNLTAYANAVYGALFVHPGSMTDVDPDDPSIVSWSDDGVEYKMVPTEELPLLDPLRATGFDWLADVLNDPLVEHVESAYDRPSSQQEADALFPDDDEIAAEPDAATLDDDDEGTVDDDVQLDADNADSADTDDSQGDTI